MPAQDLIKPALDRSLTTPALDQLAKLCLLCSQRRLAGLETDTEHMRLFREWVHRQVQSMEVSPMAGASDQELSDRVDSLVHSLSDTPAADAAIAMRKVLSNIDRIFSGQAQSLEILLSDETLSKRVPIHRRVRQVTVYQALGPQQALTYASWKSVRVRGPQLAAS